MVIAELSADFESMGAYAKWEMYSIILMCLYSVAIFDIKCYWH